MLNTKALAASASAAKVYVEEVFSTWLYDGNGSTQTITNGIDLSGKGGLVWIRSRSQAVDHQLFDTARGATKELISNSTAAETTDTDTLTAFNTDGFSLGADATTNTSGAALVSWTFRKAAKFFDVVTYTGNGVNGRTIAHDLGSEPGCIIIKRTDVGGSDWIVYHRSLGSGSFIRLNLTNASTASGVYWNSTAPTSSVFTLGNDLDVNGSTLGGAKTYVAYLFAHDAGGFGDSGNDNVISCGSYTGNGSASGPTVTLGWEPQWLLIRRTDVADNWNIIDNTRGSAVDSTDYILSPNVASSQEDTVTVINIEPTGFRLNTTNIGYNANGGNYIYIAIRRGPMKTPTDATKVFQAKVYTGTNVDNRLVTTDILTDMVWARQRNDSVLAGMVVGDRLRGQPCLLTGSTAAQVNDADSFDAQLVGGGERGNAWSSMTGFWVGNDPTRKLNANTTANNHIAHAFRRAPIFFDAVTYVGTGAARTVSHNLGAIPELIIIKEADLANSWAVYAAAIGNTKYLTLNTDSAEATLSTYWNNTSPTASVFTVGTKDDVNQSQLRFIAYLFATCPGVSKVGSYTGSGTTKQIDCGFTNGARFILIKCVNDVGSWYIFDSARGIVSGSDPYLFANETLQETSEDYIDPYSAGFEISSTAPAAINANGGSFIFLAVA